MSWGRAAIGYLVVQAWLLVGAILHRLSFLDVAILGVALVPLGWFGRPQPGRRRLALAWWGAGAAAVTSTAVLVWLRFRGVQ